MATADRPRWRLCGACWCASVQKNSRLLAAAHKTPTRINEVDSIHKSTRMETQDRPGVEYLFKICSKRRPAILPHVFEDGSAAQDAASLPRTRIGRRLFSYVTRMRSAPHTRQRIGRRRAARRRFSYPSSLVKAKPLFKLREFGSSFVKAKPLNLPSCSVSQTNLSESLSTPH